MWGLLTGPLASPRTGQRRRAAYPGRRRDVLDYGDYARLPTVNMVVWLIEQAAPVDGLGL